MQFRATGSIVLIAVVIAALLAAPLAHAQTATGILRGVVTDPSGAAVPQATVAVTSSSGQTLTAKTTTTGSYEIKGLAADTYTLTVNADGFAVYELDTVQILAGQIQKADARLALAAEQQKIQVSGQAVHVDVNPENNAGALVIQGKDLEALSDDPDELENELQALAGPSAGPNGGQMYIDGFTAGQLPPKSSIREIRINQNPFSAEYDTQGFGRIEIFTKPGTGQTHGQFFLIGNDSSFNTLDPFVTSTPPYRTIQFSGNVSGPINKKMSYFFEVEQRNINNANILDGETLSSTFAPTPFSSSVINPQTRTTISPRLDFQFGANDTLTARYQFTRAINTNTGLGGQTLQSQAYNSSDIENTLQLDETHVISSRALTETRFQYIHESDSQTPQSLLPEVEATGDLFAGGNSGGTLSDMEDHYELQSYTQIAFSRHSIRFGGRFRDVNVTNNTTSGFNGTYSFSALSALQAIENGSAAGSVDCVSPPGSGFCDESGFTNLNGIGVTNPVGPDRFTITAGPIVNGLITTGNPVAKVNLWDVGIYAEDDWKIFPTLTLSYGLRLESQNHISDHADWAPRVMLSWGLGHSKAGPTTVIRIGSGIFYSRFTDDLVLQTLRYNGVNEQQYVVSDPNFFYPNGFPSQSVESTALMSASSIPAVDEIAPNLRAPYALQSAASVERQIGKSATVTVNYLNSRGVHQFFTEPCVFQLNSQCPTTENIYEYESEAEFEQNQLITSVNYRLGNKITLTGYYTLNYARSDSGGAGSFPSNPANILADYGRATFDVRNRIALIGTITLPKGFRLNPFIVAQSGNPYNITDGLALNGTSIFNQRPGFVSSTACATVTVTGADYCTPLGTFDSNGPTGDETLLPINYGTGPTLFAFNLRVSKTFGFGGSVESAANTGQQGGNRGGPGQGGGPGGPGAGPGPGQGGGPGGGGGGRGGGGFGGGFGGGGGGRGGGGGGPVGLGGGGVSSGQKYTLTLSANVRNLFNIANLGTPDGSLTSPLFGRSIGTAGFIYASGTADRRIDLQLTFSF